MGVLLELKGMGCRHLEHVLQAMKTGWYHFLSRCMDYGGIFKRLDLAKNLQYIMGHASITITLDLYAHASEAGANREMRSLIA